MNLMSSIDAGCNATRAGGHAKRRNREKSVAHLDTATVVASAVPSRWARCTELAGDSQRYNAHPFSDGGGIQMRPRSQWRPLSPSVAKEELAFGPTDWAEVSDAVRN